MNINCTVHIQSKFYYMVKLYFIFISKNDSISFKLRITAQKMKFSIKDFFSKCDQIRRKLRIWSHLLKKSLIFLYVKICIIWKCIQYTMHRDKTQMFQKITFGQNKWYKKFPLFSFDSVSFLLKFIFLFKKKHGLFDFKTS